MTAETFREALDEHTEAVRQLAADSYRGGGRDALTAVLRAMEQVNERVAASVIRAILDEKFDGPSDE